MIKSICMLFLFTLLGVKSNVIILVMGCHMEDIQQDRVNTAVDYVKKERLTDVTWYLSGGTKHSLEGTSEAEKMSESLKKDWSYKLDTNSRNTSENLANFRMYLETKSFDEIFIATSEFHFKRASELTKGVLQKNTKWILGKKSCPSCWSDEIIHSKNIQSDINKSLRLIGSKPI